MWCTDTETTAHIKCVCMCICLIKILGWLGIKMTKRGASSSSFIQPSFSHHHNECYRKLNEWKSLWHRNIIVRISTWIRISISSEFFFIFLFFFFYYWSRKGLSSPKSLITIPNGFQGCFVAQSNRNKIYNRSFGKQTFFFFFGNGKNIIYL